MKKIIIILAAVCFASSVFAARTYLYVSHNQAKKISVIDTSTNQLMSEIKLPCFPKDMNALDHFAHDKCGLETIRGAIDGNKRRRLKPEDR